MSGDATRTGRNREEGQGAKTARGAGELTNYYRQDLADDAPRYRPDRSNTHHGAKPTDPVDPNA